MTIARTKEMDLRSSDYEFLTGLTDGSTTIDSGEVTRLGTNTGFVLTDIAISTKYTFIVKASQVKALKAGEAISAGDALFFDATNDVVTKTTATGLFPCGVAMETVLLGDTYVLMNFNGIAATAVPA